MRLVKASVLTLLTAFTSATAADINTDALDKVFESFRDTAGPGCAVAASRDGMTVYERGFGMANLDTGTAINPASIFHVASVSKQFTATAILLLAREGRLTLDDDIRKHLPEMPDYGTPITVRHLLHHTSGLRDQWDLLAMARGRFAENRITDADVMDIVPRQKALNFKPGSEHLYSNTGYTLLGVIVTRVSGKSLREFANERIFVPLGMRNTHFHDDYTMVVPGRASAYERRPDKAWHVSIPNFDTVGATSLFSTVGDLLKWEDNFRKPVVGDAELIKQMETVGVLDNGKQTGYGLGVAVGSYRGARLVDHGGADAGYRAYAGRYPDRGLALAIACNAGNARPGRLASAMADVLIGDQLDKAAVLPERKEPAFTAAELANRAGIYVQPVSLHAIELTVHDGKLVQGEKDGPALGQVGDNRYQIQVAGDSLEFVDGNPGGLYRHNSNTGPVYYERHVPVRLDGAALAAYQGSYVSEELGNARYRISVSGDRLMVATGTEKALPARQLYRHAFDLDGDMLQFQEKNGRVTGFDITTRRARHVKFAREALR